MRGFPFDFAQGRLFGDDNEKGKSKTLHPTLRKSAKNGAPGRLGLVKDS
jgi:hypothetical protein